MEINRYSWHSWWAWYPIIYKDCRRGNRRVAWLKWVIRRRTLGTLPPESGASDAFWEYDVT